MPHAARSSLVLLALAVACSPTPEAASEPAKAAPVEASTPSDPAAPVTGEPVPPTAAEPTVPAAEASPLRVVAVREGPVGLLRHRDAPLLTIESEPVPLVDGSFSRRPNGGAGLIPRAPAGAIERVDLAFAGSFDDPHGAWISTMHAYERTAEIYSVYHHTGDRWEAVDLRKGVLVAYYSAFVERDGAVLALQGWTMDPAQDIDARTEQQERVAAALRTKARRALDGAAFGWVRLAGAEAPMPELPAGTRLRTAVTTGDGTLHALAHAQPEGDERSPPFLLAWQPGSLTAERIEVPGLDPSADVALGASGEHTVIHGHLERDDHHESYLAVGRGREWQRVAVRLPGSDADAATSVLGAARAPDGELWIAVGDRWMDEEGGEFGPGGGDVLHPLWRKPVDGDWQPVAVPTVSADVFGPKKAKVRDIYDEKVGWVEIERDAVDIASAEAGGLVWAADAVWATLEIGSSYRDDSVSDNPQRTVVVTSRPGSTPPTLLPPAWEVHLERQGPAVVGSTEAKHDVRRP